MSKCNLLQELNNNNGTFIQFQNYTNDLAKQLADFEGWRIIPSKYMCVELSSKASLTGKNYDKLLFEDDKDNVRTILNGDSDFQNIDNKTIPYILQSFYENSCAFVKGSEKTFVNLTNEEKTFQFNPEVYKSLFWQTLERSGLLGKIDKGDLTDKEAYIYPNVKYIGDINIKSCKDYDGINNTEIYIYVPEDAKRTEYYFYPQENMDLYTSKYEDEEHNIIDTLVGWKNNYPINATLDNKPLLSSYNKNKELGEYENVTFGGKYTFMPDFQEYIEDVNDKKENTNYYLANSKEQEDNSFTFNTIIIFYDIMYNDDKGNIKVKYSGLPLGMYITGKALSGEISNYITKYVSNEDIFGQGTAYSLRLCTKFMALQNVNSYTTNIEVSDDNLDDLNAIMSEFGATQKSINKLLENEKLLLDKVENQFSNFRNYKVNVPYTRTINGFEYWFVNGKMTGAVAISEDTLKSLINRIEELENKLK